MEILVYETKALAVRALAIDFIQTARKYIAANGRFSVALSGGSTPKDLYKLLANEYADALEWNKVYFFFGDERNVAADNKDYNGKMVMEALLLPLKISPDNVFFVNTTLSADAAAKDYTDRLEAFFGAANVTFDLILLGMGDDGHTASLFPHSKALGVTEKLVVAHWVEQMDTYRYTFTSGLINDAKNVYFLVAGKEKAEAVKHVLDNTHDTDMYPAKLIKPINGNLKWYLDEAAAEKAIKR